MLIDQILLQIFYKLNNERTINAAYHLLRGKRSGQTIQDVGLFKLYPYFGILRKLAKPSFDDGVSRLVDRDLLKVEESGYFTVTSAGHDELKKLEIPFYDGWHYRGNEHVFFARLSLIIQTLSYQTAGHKYFLPVQRDEQTQAWCRGFLMDTQFHRQTLQEPLYEEMLSTLENAHLSEQQRQLVLNRLSGAHVAGVAWQQMSVQWQLPELDCQLLFISALHSWLEEIRQQQPFYLSKMTGDIRVENVLTGSAYQTAQLYMQGYTLEQISHMRQLKMSTIEDHIVELAMNEPHFDIRFFVKEADELAVQEATQTYMTKKLKVLREVLPHLSYFQIRLALARGEE